MGRGKFLNFLPENATLWCVLLASVVIIICGHWPIMLGPILPPWTAATNTKKRAAKLFPNPNPSIKTRTPRERCRPIRPGESGADMESIHIRTSDRDDFQNLAKTSFSKDTYVIKFHEYPISKLLSFTCEVGNRQTDRQTDWRTNKRRVKQTSLAEVTIPSASILKFK